MGGGAEGAQVKERTKVSKNELHFWKDHYEKTENNYSVANSSYIDELRPQLYRFELKYLVYILYTKFKTGSSSLLVI